METIISEAPAIGGLALFFAVMLVGVLAHPDVIATRRRNRVIRRARRNAALRAQLAEAAAIVANERTQGGTR